MILSVMFSKLYLSSALAGAGVAGFAGATADLSALSEDGFFAYIDKQIREHLNNESGLTKSFVYLYGFGQIYPYLRTNTFLSNFERYNHGEDYKIIVFYPGYAKRNSFSLFGCLKDDHTYRSINLINE